METNFRCMVKTATNDRLMLKEPTRNANALSQMVIAMITIKMELHKQWLFTSGLNNLENIKIVKLRLIWLYFESY